MSVARTKVFGIGWAKTGTTTLGECLRILGYKHQTQRLDLVECLDPAQRNLEPIYALADKHESFDDWPWLLLFREFDARYPGSKFVLTVRDPAPWIKSYRNMIGTIGAAKPTPEMNRKRTILYDLPFPEVTDQQLIERYQRHNAEVQAHFAGRPQDLLVVDWSRGDGWPQLCSFLGVPVPEQAFPHANKGAYKESPPSLWQRLRKRLLSS